MTDDFLAVVVLYKVSVSQCKTLITLNSALEYTNTILDVMVYDNSPQYNDNQNTSGFANLNLIYHPDPANPGVSRAYNCGHAIAVERKKKWLLLLDQDTELPENAIDEYLKAIKQYVDACLFVPIMMTSDGKIISPGKFKLMRGYYASNIDFGINYLEGYSLINSGLCVGVDAFSKNGGYNDLIKLDYSDHDFVRRFKKNVTNQCVVIELKVSHNLSTSVSNTLESDKIRFSYYLNGGKRFASDITMGWFINVIALLRTIKLSINHKSSYFIRKYFTCLFSRADEKKYSN